MNQRTIKRPIKTQGIGLHSGNKVNLKFVPAPTNCGILFRRTDLMVPVEIPAHNQFGKEAVLCTLLEKEGVQIKTIEHLMAAVNALGIDNLIVEVDSDEIPIMDGSATVFYKLLKAKGFKEQKANKKFIRILKPIEVKKDNKSASLFPANESSFSFFIDFKHQAIGKQSYYTSLSPINFMREISSARTFGFEEEVNLLKDSGKILGGSLDNAILLGEDGDVVNKSGLRYNDEFVRHKILDSMGDLALAGCRILGHYHGDKSSHAMNHLLLTKLFENPNSWEYVEEPMAVERRMVA